MVSTGYSSRTGLQFPVPTGQLRAACNSDLRGHNALLASIELHACGIQPSLYTQTLKTKNPECIIFVFNTRGHQNLKKLSV